MIFIAFGANLKHPRWGSPLATCGAALAALAGPNLKPLRRSRWYESAPIPVSDQPWYVNGIAEVSTGLDPVQLLAQLHGIEADFGRVRGVPNAARVLDLDLIAYGDRVSAPGEAPILPHPRMHERLFVLLPLAELAPAWRHPRLGVGIGDLIEAQPEDRSTIRPIPGDSPQSLASQGRAAYIRQ
jgi:2-amino-4-hydroxy-6-hydroxymethyldihydropteridine diphosphokinase